VSDTEAIDTQMARLSSLFGGDDSPLTVQAKANMARGLAKSGLMLVPDHEKVMTYVVTRVDLEILDVVKNVISSLDEESGRVMTESIEAALRGGGHIILTEMGIVICAMDHGIDEH
jgi:hypothetical protein